MSTQLVYWVWASLLGVNAVKERYSLLRCFSTLEEAYLCQEPPFSTRQKVLRDGFLDKSLEKAEKVISRCRELGIDIITLEDSRYPEKLRSIEDPPLLIYARGEMQEFDRLGSVTLIGSRNASESALRTACAMGYALALNGATVISGFARGVDAAASRGAADAGGSPVGVLGCGLDVIYPRENRKLFERTYENGLLISEYPPGTEPKSFNFPVRNRIMSALADAVAVISAGVKSGTLITARLAAEQGRELFAVPGPVDEAGSRGSNELIRDGAHCLLTPEDILDTLRWKYENIRSEYREPPAEPLFSPEKTEKPAPAAQKKPKKEIDNGRSRDYIGVKEIPAGLTGPGARIAALLAAGPVHVDELAERSGLPMADLMTELTMLELDGVAEGSEGFYTLK